MNSKEAILKALRESLRDAEPVARPSLDAEWVSYPDVLEQFIAAAGELPARIVRAAGSGAVAVEQLAVYRDARRLHSFVEGIASRGAPPGSPHDAQDLDLTVARGKFGVAESGAIWVDGAGIEPRAALFLAQHLILLLDGRNIVPHLHAAYEHLDVAAHAYGAFIAGPSKTADIEQALVIGAHGARSLTIVLT